MKYSVLIVDNEPMARRGIRVRLKPYPDFTILDDCENGERALEAIREHAPDLVFLDVQMPRLNGFEMLKVMPKNRHPLIIFLTAYDQYALHAFDVHAFDYLVKPVDSERFAEAIRRARRHLQLRAAGSLEDRLRGLLAEYAPAGKTSQYLERFAVRTGNRLSFFLVDEIDWIEAVGDYAGLHVGEKRPLLRDTLNNLGERLDPKKFVRIHRSTIIQVSRIRELQRLPNRDLRLVLTTGTTLKVSRTYRDRLDEWLSS